MEKLMEHTLQRQMAEMRAENAEMRAQMAELTTLLKGQLALAPQGAAPSPLTASSQSSPPRVAETYSEARPLHRALRPYRPENVHFGRPQSTSQGVEDGTRNSGKRVACDPTDPARSAALQPTCPRGLDEAVPPRL